MEIIEEEDQYLPFVVKDQLFKKAMAGDWLAVVDIYREDPLARKAIVTRAKHTVLHLAVSEEDDNVVEQLLNAIEEDEACDILSLQNEFGDTPLHVAAALGLPRICRLLAEKCKELVVNARNDARETPLYIAAHHGKEEVFFVLHDYVAQLKVSKQPHHIYFWRRGDRNTILHAAVHGEHFGLAIEIINLYPGLVNFINEKGESPLHLLANMPLAFKSGTRLGRINKLIYSCIIVDQLEPKYQPSIDMGHPNQWKKENEIESPQNYATCKDLFRVLYHVYRLIVSCFGERSIRNCYTANKGQSLKDNNKDAQNAPISQKDPERGEEYGNHVRSAPKIPENYITAYSFLKITRNVLLTLLGIGIHQRIDTLKRKKKRHEHASQVMKELVRRASYWEYYEEDGRMPRKHQKLHESTIDISRPPDEEGSANTSESSIEESPILIAAKLGVVEIVQSILNYIPQAVHDVDSNHKNIILLSLEHRQIQVYKYLVEMKGMQDGFLGVVDKDGNTALHLAARVAENNHPWLIPKIALQMQWEFKWYKFVKNSMEPSFFKQYNNKGETAREIFSKSHESLVKEGGKWLTNTSQSCSVIAALIATVAYASATTVPGGVDQTSGFPIFEGKPAFDVFAISALLALCFSITSLIMFLSILTSHFQEKEFKRDLPRKLIFGLTALFMSIIAMLVSFYAGHFFVMEEKLKYGALPIYIVTCLPITFFAVSKFPVYVDLVRGSIADIQ